MTIKNILSQYKGLSKSAYVFFFASLVTSMGAFIWPMLTLILTQKLGYTATETVTLFVAISVVFLPAQIIGGKLADRYNKKKIIITFDIISVVFFFGCAIVGPSTLMVVFFIISGLFANMEGPSFQALIAETTLPKEREKVYSLSYLGHNLGFIFGASMAGLLFTNYLSLAFFLDGLTTITSTIMIIMMVHVIKHDEIKEVDRNEYEDSVHAKTSVRHVLSTRKSIVIQIVIYMLAAFIYDQWSFVIPLYMAEVFGTAGPKYFGFVSSFNGFLVILFTPVLTYMLRKHFEIPKMILGVFLYSISYIIVSLTPFLFVFFIFMFFFTIGEIVNMLGSSPYISRRVPSSHRGRINSYIGVAYFIGSISGKFVTGVLIDNYGYASAFNLLFLVGVIATVLAIFNYRVDKKLFPNLYKKEALKELIKESIF